MSATCKGCGAPIVWATRPNWKTIPLTRIKKVYLLDEAGVAQDSALTGVYCSHFETCPKASEFSKGGKT